MLRISRRAVVRIVSFISLFAFTIGTLVITGEMKVRKLQSEITNEELRSLGDLTTYMNDIRSTVLKGIYSSSDKSLSAVASNLSAQCAAARSSLGNISNDGNLLDRTYLFLAQVSDFAASLADKASHDEKITPEDVNTLYSFMDYAGGIGEEISTLLSKVQSGEISVSGDLSPNDRPLSSEVNSTVTTIDENFSEYPTLVYNGPFSDHIMNKTPLMTSNAPEVDEATAREVAAKALGVTSEELSGGEPSEGNMPAFNFSKDNAYISISRGGGHLIYMIKEENPADILMNAEDAVKKAAEYLSFLGYKDMSESYYEISDGICYINFAYTIGGGTVYPDLVKVGVSLENGGILSFDARGYLVNHTNRNLTPTISISEARSHLPESATVISEGMAITPGRNAEERLCYEFRCKGARDENLLLYVDALSGEEVSVLILLIGENGTLAI